MSPDKALLEALFADEYRALARVVSKIKDCSLNYRDLVSELSTHTGGAVARFHW
ncbi:hypothetical protein [Natrinema sp. DC36]|uniref:hypothetical protein n=1 Tax=Natrinema sp. DC36 TaxID=2878680 RepID=UPI0031F2E92C